MIIKSFLKRLFSDSTLEFAVLAKVYQTLEDLFRKQRKSKMAYNFNGVLVLPKVNEMMMILMISLINLI